MLLINLKHSKSVGLSPCIVHALDKIADIGTKQMNANFQTDWGQNCIKCHKPELFLRYVDLNIYCNRVIIKFKHKGK